MQQLSGLDASFIYMETNRTPMHIGSVYLLDVTTAPGFNREMLRTHVAARLPRLPVFRQRLVEVPLDLGHPFWINDPDFNLDDHLVSLGCPRPGGKAELMALAAQRFARPLDRGRPLWDMTLVDGIDQYPGLPPGSMALICRIHHAAVDGVSGAELMGALLDLSPNPDADDVIDQWRPEPVPSPVDMLRQTYTDAKRKSLQFPRFLRDVTVASLRRAAMRRLRRLDPPARLLDAPPTVFNDVIGPTRTFGGVEFDLDHIKALKNALPGVTVNDVLLAIAAGGLRRLLARSGELPAEPMIAMMPVSVRTGGQSDQSGNQVDAMLVELATDEASPLARLGRICGATRQSKAYGEAIPAARIMEFVPSETAALAARLYTRMRVADRHGPFFNLVITNVPGPPLPLYIAGARIASVFGTAPVFDGLGLILVVFSQAGRISIGITACRRMLPDASVVEGDLEASLDELAAAIGLAAAPANATVPAPTTLTELGKTLHALGQSIQQLEQNIE